MSMVLHISKWKCGSDESLEEKRWTALRPVSFCPDVTSCGDFDYNSSFTDDTGMRPTT
jgi:hypothetical protein